MSTMHMFDDQIQAINHLQNLPLNRFAVKEGNAMKTRYDLSN